jgi:hypothetical protein
MKDIGGIELPDTFIRMAGEDPVSSVANSESSATSPKSEEPKKSSLPAGSVAKSDGSGSDKKASPPKGNGKPSDNA